MAHKSSTLRRVSSLLDPSIQHSDSLDHHRQRIDSSPYEFLTAFLLGV